MITVQFANGKIFQAENLDAAIAECLAGGDDPFNPIIITEQPKQETKAE